MLSTEATIGIIGGTTAIVTAIWHAAMYIGKLTNKIERHADILTSHDERLRDLMAMKGHRANDGVTIT